MTDRMRVIIEGSDQASDDMQRVSQSARRMGQDVERAGQQADRGFRGVRVSAQEYSRVLDAIERNTAETARAMQRMGTEAERTDRSLGRLRTTGASLGAATSALVGVLAEASRAAAEEEAIFSRLEAAVDATGDSFDALSPSINQAVADAESLSFADDQAADALTRLTATTGDAERAIDLLSLTMDVARGRNISLAAAADLVGKVSAGNLGILTRYGIVLQEGATATEALATLQERFAGQSEAYAATTQGSIDRLRNSFDNWVESIGANTGELQTLLAILPGISVAFTATASAIGAVVAPLGRVATSARAASLAMGAMNLALGPVGIIAAAVGAGLAIRELVQHFDDMDLSMSEIEGTTTDLIAALNQLSEAGTAQPVLQAIRANVEFLQEVGRTSQALAGELFDATNQLDIERERLNNILISGTSEQVAAQQAVVDAITAQVAALEGAILTEEQYNQAVEDTIFILSDAARINYPELSAAVKQLQTDLAEGDITADEYVDGLRDIAENVDSVGLELDDLAPKIGAITQLFDVAAGPIRDVGAAVRDLVPEQLRFLAQYTAEFGEAARAIGTTDLAAGLRSVEEAHDGASAAARDGAAAERDFQAAAIGAFATADKGAADLASLAAATDAAAVELTEYQIALRSANDGLLSYGDQLRLNVAVQGELSGALGEYRTQLGYVQDAEDILRQRQADGIALTEEQIAFLARVDDLQSQAAGSTEDLTIELGLQAAAWLENAEATNALAEALTGADSGVVVLAQAVGDLADAIDELNGTPIDTDKLRVPESVIASWHELNRTIGAKAPGDASGGPAVQQQTTAPANQTPLSQDLLSPVVIPVQLDTRAARIEAGDFNETLREIAGGDYTIVTKMNAEGVYSEIENAEGEIVALVSGDYVVEVNGDSSNAQAEIAAALSALQAVDGSSANVAVYANTAPAQNSINALTGYQGDAWINLFVNSIPTPGTLFAHGGVIAPSRPERAQTGRVVEMAENGPEMVYGPNGRNWLAAQHGLFVAEGGSYVSPAPMTRANGVGGNLIININAPVFGLDDLRRHIFEALANAGEAAIGDRFVELGMT